MNDLFEESRYVYISEMYVPVLPFDSRILIFISLKVLEDKVNHFKDYNDSAQ